MNTRHSFGYPQAAEHVRVGSPILILISLLGGLLGIVLLVGGLLLAFVQRFAETKFTFIGNQFSSTSVGVSMAFIGAVLIVFTFRRVLRSLDHLAALPPDQVSESEEKPKGRH